MSIQIFQWAFVLIAFLSNFITAAPGTGLSSEVIAQSLTTRLKPFLSGNASISNDTLTRWSTYKAPDPAVVVNVKTEADVAATVRGKDWTTISSRLT